MKKDYHYSSHPKPGSQKWEILHWFQHNRGWHSAGESVWKILIDGVVNNCHDWTIRRRIHELVRVGLLERRVLKDKRIQWRSHDAR